MHILAIFILLENERSKNSNRTLSLKSIYLVHQLTHWTSSMITNLYLKDQIPQISIYF